MALPFVKKHWGKIYFILWCLGSIISLLVKGIPSGHFDIFISAPKLLFNGENPYGIVYEYGAFVYSPMAALFYAPFAALPYVWGLGLLSIVSIVVFMWGITSLLKCSPLERASIQDIKRHPFLLNNRINDDGGLAITTNTINLANLKPTRQETRYYIFDLFSIGDDENLLMIYYY